MSHLTHTQSVPVCPYVWSEASLSLRRAELYSITHSWADRLAALACWKLLLSYWGYFCEIKEDFPCRIPSDISVCIRDCASHGPNRGFKVSESPSEGTLCSRLTHQIIQTRPSVCVNEQETHLECPVAFFNITTTTTATRAAWLIGIKLKLWYGLVRLSNCKGIAKAAI